jgi:mannose-6-phosphate isomerase-like protein (cupin superfamily)
MSFHINVLADAKANDNFRKVIFTGQKSQLVLMSIPAGEEIGAETHHHVEQTLFFISGSGKAVLDGVESPVNAGDVYVVTPGTFHNFINTGKEPMKIYTVYAPANHIDGRIHVTKKDADADNADEAFGESVK